MKLRTVTILSAAILVSMCCFFSLMAFNAKSGTKGKSPVTFYKVPLVCSAAPDIGCGSKAKPVLKQLETSSSIAEAWLNHTGTVIAVVWKENNNTAASEKSTMAIFKEQNMDVQMVAGKEYNAMLDDFNKDKKNWLRHTDVDQLSLIEAGEIASRIVARVNAKTPLSNETASSLKADFENLFKNRFITMKTTDINKDPNLVATFKQKTEDDLLAAGKKYLDATQMNALQTAIELGLQPVEGEPGYAKDGCCSKPNDSKQKCGTDENKKKGCCSKTSN